MDSKRWFAGVLGMLCGVDAYASDVVVCRVGDGATTLTSAATAVFLEERDSAGNIGGVITLPISASAGNQPITLSGTATSEGELAVSVDGRYITLAGYAAIPGTASVAGTSSAIVNRVVARVDATAVVDTSSLLASEFSAGNVRGAVSVDGSAFWVSGTGISGTGGVWYLALGPVGNATQVLNNPGNVREINIAAGQLYADSISGTFTNVFTIGTGLPTTAAQAATSLAGLPTASASPNGFVFFDRHADVAGIDTLYIADDSTIGFGGGIQKWTFNGSTWFQSATFTSGLSSGVRGLAAEAVGANIVLYATTAEATGNHLVRLVDDGSPSPLAVSIATASANTAYRGVSLAWTAPVVDVIFKDGFD